MILAILIIALILAFIFLVLPVIKGSKIVGFAFLLVVIACSVGIIANDTYHWGMKEQTTTKTYQLTSSAGSSSSTNILLYQGLGNGSEKVYVYKTTASSKRQVMKTTDSSAKVTSTTGQAVLKLKTTRYVYKNGFYKALFNLVFDNNGQLKHRTYQFEVPDSWYVLSVKQAQKLAAAAQKDPTGMQTAIASRVQSIVTAEMTNNPTMSTEQQQALTTKATKQATMEYINSLK
ncbi:DUF4811 domain-containing protein [Limosilactobacillus gastricus]|uniref:DUF4811 domain-containing protein n=1 Tax=Limosilactobacillus gastricus TaxID=227942 RepID=UPI0026F1041A|nr:DUF4811 domain-containing protein [Limosilactobacillus gastricus]